MKINFTQEHFQRMQQLLLGMLLNNETVSNKLGQPLNAVELLHTTSIQGLNSIRLSLAKQIENLENQDEWVASPVTQNKLESLKVSKELVNLIRRRDRGSNPLHTTTSHLQYYNFVLQLAHLDRA